MNREAAELLRIARVLVSASSELKILNALSKASNERLDIEEVGRDRFKAVHQRDGVELTLSRMRRPNWHNEFTYFELFDFMIGRMPLSRAAKFRERLDSGEFD